MCAPDRRPGLRAVYRVPWPYLAIIMRRSVALRDRRSHSVFYL